ncbi:MAG: NusG domain II-containing protein [Oscillospiraceae bacterium]|nr:NusG domain II-containing protein [Oscillospiraceae bacterium]
MKDKAKNKKRADLILIGALLLLALVMGGWLLLTRQTGARVVVYVDGEAQASYPLDKDTRVTLRHPNGSYNELVIENGVADVVEAGCPDKICVMMHAIRYDGESIICLPNRTEIRIEGGEPSGTDTIVP